MRPCHYRCANWLVALGGLALAMTTHVVAAEKQHVLLIAGRPSHGYGSHEHYAGLKVLEESLNASSDSLEVTVVRGWPDNASLIEKADSIVIYSDGGGGHLAIPHREALRKKLDTGCGFVCLHYAVEVPKGDVGNDWLEFLGGYFETDWSVNPHWVADFKSLPEHPITHGVKPFAANDEWYFHMRFHPSRKVTPILAAVAPEETMRRPDGPHSGNPDVRKSVAAGEEQVVAWAFEREGGGKSFGFTGGHYHWNWGNESVRRLVTNAIRWTAGQSIPDAGSEIDAAPLPKLLENQDEEPPKNFSPEKIAEEFHLSSTASKPIVPIVGKLVSQTLKMPPLVTTQTPGHRVEMEVPIAGVRDLFLVATDGGNGYGCDWIDWIDPTLSGRQGTKSLSELDWVSATSGWGSVRKNANCNGDDWRVDGAKIGSACIGAHANSVIHFRIPDGYETFTVIGALDSGGTRQHDGQETSVRFALFADALPADLSELESNLSDSIRGANQAIAGLTVAEGLQVTLVASEPQLRSLTNLDIDDRGRIWVCDVMNYRKNAGSRPEGDRILILEDTTGDGVADSVKTFYQGTDIDSAMGICVLGNQVIVTATPTVWRFTDNDGDDIPDSKEAMFTQVGQPQHDHSAHSFLFGPDGKLYWNFGNTGQQVKDADGQTVIDIHGRPVVDDGKPFYGGMPFRCNLDGTEFEVLAHNFRNNWETTVDSFGSLWQSDNDDDGNRGTRINFVMEHGNYGYRDELTGGTWQQDRITLEKEIPLRHWHLNDPGVVPNLLQTGAGSPSGICFYEGRLLPRRYWNSMIHCEPGANIVRAYPTQVDGAGYTATIEPVLTGTTDKWFRPADVCTAPDGSIFVTDWYDPGVGGHRQEDIDRGRLFRIAPPGSKYNVPKFDYSTADGAADALRSPNMAARYNAWQALHAMGREAEPALKRLFVGDEPHLRARALWLLGKIESRGPHYVQTALADSDPNIRITGIRLAKQLGMSMSELGVQVANDDSPAVRRELAIALRYDESPKMPELWATLAKQYDGKDRWYLEALGIASDLRANECFAAWWAATDGKWNTAAGRDIVWRVRADQAAPLLVDLIRDPKLPLEDTNRLFRSLEYHPASLRTEALKGLLELVDAPTASPRNDAVIVRSVQRMEGFDWNNNPGVQAAIKRHLEFHQGSAEFLKLVKQFRPNDFEPALVTMTLTTKNDSEAVEAIRLLAETPNGPKQLRDLLQGQDVVAAQRVAELLGLLGNGRSIRMLGDTVADAERAYDVRSIAVKGLARNNVGAQMLLELATNMKLPADTRLLVGGLLARSSDEKVAKRAAELLPQPQQANQSPVPPLDDLVKIQGDAVRGQELFRTKATCSNCHLVSGHGKQVGPDLSEIGSKLSREAMFTSILDPSAGISHNYESYSVLTDSGLVVTGVKVGETDDEIVIRTAEAIDRTLSKDEIDEIKKSEKSIMPDNLHQTIDQQGLVDVIEYLMTLQKK